MKVGINMRNALFAAAAAMAAAVCAEPFEIGAGAPAVIRREEGGARQGCGRRARLRRRAFGRGPARLRRSPRRGMTRRRNFPLKSAAVCGIM